jgi:hypothetical protein
MTATANKQTVVPQGSKRCGNKKQKNSVPKISGYAKKSATMLTDR